ncbi:DUF2911 domain-containing protein [Pedobacter nyackensis]|uniref:DUF2911 domain-containing protein n=1 Tax=Pedobacter nyackensis TaxID=475255 RepID=A0A1W2BQ21_9SPHI|nr:DUF2911 domain-containing protein [Pedobacter nyackensis]SMC75049.1 Protein of unknown function [Pedobacter nyackensis]
MKRLSFIAVFAMFTFAVEAQEPKFAPVDASPADIVYYPLNVAKAKDAATPSIKVVYSRPTKKGRDIFGVLEQYGKVWRVGANECTEVKFFKGVRIGGKSIKPGSYSLFAIPNKDKWTLIVNKQTDRWGAFTYDEKKDVIRVDVPVKTLDKPVESFSVTFTEQPKGANLVMAWDKTLVELPIEIK